MKLLQTALIGLMMLLLTACGPVRNHSNDYVNARSIPELKVPKGVPAEKFESYYPIPKKIDSKEVAAASLVPPGLEDAVAENTNK